MGMIGVGRTCPRCGGPKPSGSCGKGIALSRRGRAAICSDCGTEEAVYDWAKRNKSEVPPEVERDEIVLRAKLKANSGLRR